MLCFFFFSSRRRHTRCLSDWSSDVCSSDLPRSRASAASPSPHRGDDGQGGDGDAAEARDRGGGRGPGGALLRSEERRVGKEWGARGRVSRTKTKARSGDGRQTQNEVPDVAE